MKRLLIIFALLFVLVGCQSGETEETAVESDQSQIPATEAPEPTPIPPTVTPVPPTDVPEPTPIPPTATAQPPTEEPETEAMGEYAELEQALQALVDTQVDLGFPSTTLWVDAPDISFHWQGVAGMADPEAEIPLTPETPFRVDINSAMMTASVMLRLAEEGMLDLDDPISQYLDPTITDLLKGPNDEPYGEIITIRQVLNLTSGVADHLSPTQENHGPENFADIFVDDPQKVWEPAEAIAFSTDRHPPQFAPGESWGFSNTNFILDGLIIEKVTGMSLADAYEKYLFGPLGMTNTFMAEVDDPRLEGVVHPYFINTDVAEYPSLSWLWGIGGVVTTADDLNRFMWALVNDEIFSDPASKEEMMNWTSMSSAGFDGIYYGLGIIQIDFGEFGMPEVGVIQGHNGLWNGFVYYWPQYNVVFGGSLNQVVPDSVYTELGNPAMFTLLPYLADG